jgi:hypothetical protein
VTIRAEVYVKELETEEAFNVDTYYRTDVCIDPGVSI